MVIFFNFFTHFKSSSSTTSRVVVDEDANVKSGLKGLIWGQTYANFDVETHILFPLTVSYSDNKTD